MLGRLVQLPPRLSRSIGQQRGPAPDLVDKFGRKHDYLRISLTERCNLRCKYCMPEEGIKLSRSQDNLSLDEIKRLSVLFVDSLGVKKIRLTGGEPTIDGKLVPILEHLSQMKTHSRLETIAMTTNGLTLKRNAALYANLKLDAVNISLDTLKADRFELMTRRKGWSAVYDGIHETIKTGMKVKINCVVIKGFNDDEVLDFVELARQNPIEVRFIEFMPFAGNKWQREKFVSYREILQLVKDKQLELSPIPLQQRGETSKVYTSNGMAGSIGFISSMSENFCSGCNRLRLTSDGNLKVCLFGNEEVSLRAALRSGMTDEEIIEIVRHALLRKKQQHPGAEILKEETMRPMIKIGGNARMVSVGSKSNMHRMANARGKIIVGRKVYEKIRGRGFEKGDVLTVAKLAGLMGAKSTSNLIPLCHNVTLDCVGVEIDFGEDLESLEVSAWAEATYKTGVEMESLTAVSIALLTIYDMCKSMNKNMVITDIRLISKTKTDIRN